MTITFNTDGTAQCLYTELIDLHQLGRLRMTRASTIEFSEKDQVWEVKINGRIVFSSDSREICLGWEKLYFN